MWYTDKSESGGAIPRVPKDEYKTDCELGDEHMTEGGLLILLGILLLLVVVETVIAVVSSVAGAAAAIVDDEDGEDA